MAPEATTTAIFGTDKMVDQKRPTQLTLMNTVEKLKNE